MLLKEDSAFVEDMRLNNLDIFLSEIIVTNDHKTTNWEILLRRIFIIVDIRQGRIILRLISAIAKIRLWRSYFISRPEWLFLHRVSQVGLYFLDTNILKPKSGVL